MNECLILSLFLRSLHWICAVPVSRYSECQEALGVENGQIPDRKISASSQWDANHASEQGRLHFQASGSKVGAWCAGRNDDNQWLQVDLGSQFTRITGVASQGRNGAHRQWVTKYKLLYSNDGINFTFYREKEQMTEKLFPGNIDEDTVVYHGLNPPIRTRYIRFQPVTWNKHISMRIEIYGCRDGFQWNFESSRGTDFLDESNNTQTYAVGSGLYVGADTLHVTESGHLKIEKRETDLDNSGDELGVSFWIKHKGHVTVAVKSDGGTSDNTSYITVNGIDYSSHSAGINFVVIDYDTGDVKFTRAFEVSDSVRQVEEFTSIILERSVVLITMNASAVRASSLVNITSQLIRDLGGNVEIDSRWYCLIGFYGLGTFPWMREQQSPNEDSCDISSVIRLPVCSTPLGMQSGEIADSQLSASNYSANFEPWQGRLNRWTGAWCTTEETLNQFLQIDLRDIKTVTHIATQGYFEGAWVKSYSLEYSADGEQWLEYKEAGGHKRIFAGNSDSTSVIRQRLLHPIQTRFLRLTILTAHRLSNNHACLRMEIYGCSKEPTQIDEGAPRFGLIGPTEMITWPGANVSIRGFYQYCESASNVLLRQPYVTVFGECRCLAPSVTPNCQSVTYYETYFVASLNPGTYSIMMGDKNDKSGCSATRMTNAINLGTIQVRPQGAYPRHCMEAQNWQGSQSRSGIFTLSLDPSGNNTFDVYCDEEWTVVQRRKDGSEIFDRGFEDYTNGFGDLAGEFWLGLRKLHLLTQTPSVLLIELQLLNGNRVFAMYKLFQVRLTGLQNENRYQLIVGNYVGTAGDALGDLNEVFFSTRDSDNDDDVVRNCAGTLGSGWWFKKCISQYTVSVDLNGNYPSGIRWRVGSTSHAITSVTMKIKPKQDILCSDEKCYGLSSHVASWNDSLTQSPNGFRPVKITNKYEQDVVSGFASSNPWIGLSTRDVHQSIWSEIGEALGLSHSEKCLRMSAQGYRWNTTPCDSQTFFIFEKDNEMSLLDLSFGGGGSSNTSLSLVYDQSSYYIRIKVDAYSFKLRLNRTTSFNEWTHVTVSLNRSNRVLTYGENGLTMSQVLLETEIPDLSWNSVAVGRSYDPAFNIGFMKSFEMRKLKIANFNAPEDGIHTLMEKVKATYFQRDGCAFEKINIVSAPQLGQDCWLAPYPVTCTERLSSVGPFHSDERKPRSLKLREDQTVKSPFISDIYGCFTLRLRSNNGWLYVFLQFTNEEGELVYVTYVEQGQKHDVYIRLKSFVRGSYQIRLEAKYNQIVIFEDSMRLTVGECESKAPLGEGFQNSFIQGDHHVTDHLYKILLGEGHHWIPCYSARKDGWEPEVFHNKCDHKPYTLFLAKANSWWIFGGYSNKPWNAFVNGSSKCLSCFLFSLVNYNGAYSPFKNVRRTNRRASILNDMSHGPSIPPDLILTGKNGTSALGQIFFSGSDDWRGGRPQEALLAGSSEFTLSELEVYYGYDVFSRVKTCFAGNVVLYVGDNMSCLLGGSKDIEHIYLEIGCDTAHKATFQINFNDRAESVRFLKDAICGSVFYFIKVYGATEITLTLLRHVKANDTSVQAIGWIGEKDQIKPLFQTPNRYWSLDNFRQTITSANNATNNGKSFPLRLKRLNIESENVTFFAGGTLNLGNVTDPCITNPVEVSCPDGFTVSFWLRLQETGSSQAHGLKILGFGEPNDNRRGFIVIERDGQVVVQVTHESFKTEVSFDVIHGVWTHIVFTFRSLITLKVYRNGENLGSRTKSYGNFVDIVQPLSTGQAVAVIDELMVWYKKFDQQTVMRMYEYLTGKPEMLWITMELKFPNKVWAEFLSEEQREVRRIEKKLNQFFEDDSNYASCFVFSFRAGSVITNVNMSFYSLGVDQAIKIHETLTGNASVIFEEEANITSYWSSDVPLYSPSNVTATPCNSLTPCLLVSWDSLPDSTLYDISGVFQYYKVRYRTVTAPFVELIVPNNDTKQDKQEVPLTNLLAYTEYTIQVFMVTLFAHGLPSDVVVVSTRAGVPGASPMNLAAVDANSSCIEITWSPIPDSLINAPSLLGYEIFWKKYNDSSFNSTMTNQTRAWLTGLQPFTDYNVLVKAVNIVGSGPGSTVLTRKTTEEALKDAPQNVSGYNKSSTSIHLIWLPIPHQPNILYYKINVNHLGSSAVSFVFTIIGLELDIQGLQKYTDYQISVCGVNTVGDGPYSVPVIISTDMDVPSAAPTELMVTRINSSSNIRLNWTSIPSEYINAPALLGYIVEYQEVGPLALQTNKTSDTWLELTLPKNDTQYLFTVSGYNERGKGPNISLAYWQLSVDTPTIWSDSVLPTRGIASSVNISPSRSSSVASSVTSSVRNNIAATITTTINTTTSVTVNTTATTSNTVATPTSNTAATVTINPNISNTSNTASTASYTAATAIGNTAATSTNSNITPSVTINNSIRSNDADVTGLNQTIKSTFNTSANIITSTPTLQPTTTLVLKNAPAGSPRKVHVSNYTSPYSLLVTWQEIHPAAQNGVILGYRVLYTLVLVSRQTEITTDIEEITVQAPTKNVLLTGLSSFSLYKIEVLGFNDVGDGPLSSPVFAETCRCPPTFSTNWWHNPPYMDADDQSKGIFPFIIQNMVPSCCQRCQAHGITTVNIMETDTDHPPKKQDHIAVRSSVEESDFSFPLFGYEGQRQFMGEYGFLAVVKSPAVVFIVPKEDTSKVSLRLLSSVFSCWPVLLLNFSIVLLSGIIIWNLDSSKNDQEFSKSFLRGAWEGMWWAFITMTTVGYGDKAPKSKMGRIFSVMATLVGLVSIAVLLGNLTTSLTTDIVFSDIKLYGSKVAAIHNSSEFRLGLRKNAKMNPGREYRNLDEVYEALLSREVDGALIDALIAGSREDLFNSSGLRIYQTFQHSSVYGMVLAGETKKLQQCFEKFMKENSAMISAHVASKTSVIKPSSKSAAVEQAMSLFDPSNNLFQDALWRCLISLAFLTVCGLTWEIIRAMRTSRMRRVHQDRQLNCSSMKVRSEMEKIVNEFYESTKGTFEQLSARHIQERKHFFIRRQNQRRSRFYSWS